MGRQDLKVLLAIVWRELDQQGAGIEPGPGGPLPSILTGQPIAGVWRMADRERVAAAQDLFGGIALIGHQRAAGRLRQSVAGRAEPQGQRRRDKPKESLTVIPDFHRNTCSGAC
jgi:hypothetical protein